MEDTSIQLFDNKKIRTQWDTEQEKWYFSIVEHCVCAYRKRRCNCVLEEIETFTFRN